MPDRAVRAALALDRAAARPWFLPAAAAFPALDYVLPFLPNQLLLAALSLLQPRRWAGVCAAFVAGAGIGAGLTAALIGLVGPALLDRLLPAAPDAARQALVLVRAHGLWALLLLAMLPWPPRTAVLVAATAGLHPLGIALAVATGRVVPAFGIAFAGSRAPHLLRRVGAVARFMAAVEAGRRG